MIRSLSDVLRSVEMFGWQSTRRQLPGEIARRDSWKWVNNWLQISEYLSEIQGEKPPSSQCSAVLFFRQSRDTASRNVFDPPNSLQNFLIQRFRRHHAFDQSAGQLQTFVRREFKETCCLHVHNLPSSPAEGKSGLYSSAFPPSINAARRASFGHDDFHQQRQLRF
jgi:hypothetical protein